MQYLSKQSPATNPDYIAKAADLLGERAELLRELGTKRVRVVRAIVYEGDAATVLEQLTRSLTEGVHNPGRPARSGGLTITIVQGDIEVDGEESPEDAAYAEELARIAAGY
jgi:hypothetical protein